MPPRPELRAAALGLLQGAAELLPVSSSAHVAAVPWLAGWEPLEPARQKELEVALHAGALLALAPTLWRLAPPPRVLALSLAPPVVLGYLFERPIESRLGGPVGLSCGLLAGATALKTWRGRPWTHWRAPAAGAAAAFISTCAALRVIGIERRGPLWPYAAERALLASAILGVRYRRNR
jgi:undecaprenyl-diphosphatase